MSKEDRKKEKQQLSRKLRA